MLGAVSHLFSFEQKFLSRKQHPRYVVISPAKIGAYYHTKITPYIYIYTNYYYIYIYIGGFP